MKFFLDTANLNELKTAAAWGVIDGVTTNPSLIAEEGVPIEQQIRRICDIVDGDISAEVVAITRDVIKAWSALAGAHVATAPFKVYDSLFNHPLTDKGLDQFLKDYHRAFAEAPVAA